MTCVVTLALDGCTDYQGSHRVKSTVPLQISEETSSPELLTEVNNNWLKEL